jgi:hypothetical protein
MTVSSWAVTDKDMTTILQIVDRAFNELRDRYPDHRRTLMMDLMACHSNACPLWLKGLLAAPTLDFSHDIGGIREHINRDTGKLDAGKGPFMPRYALVYHAAHFGTPRQHAIEPLPEGEGSDVNWCSLCRGWYAPRR